MEYKVVYDSDGNEGTLEVSFEDFGGDLKNDQFVEVFHLQSNNNKTKELVEWGTFECLENFTKKKKVVYKYVDFKRLIRIVDAKKIGNEAAYELVILCRTYDYKKQCRKEYMLKHDFSLDMFQRVRIKNFHLDLSMFKGEEVVVEGREFMDDVLGDLVVWDLFEILPANEYKDIELFFRRDAEKDKSLIEDYMNYQEQSDMMANKITDLELNKYKRKYEKMKSNVTKSVKIEGWWNNQFFILDNEEIDVSRIWFSPNSKYVFVEIWKNELYLAGKVKLMSDVVEITYVDHFENRNYGIEWYYFNVYWGELAGELLTINPETMEMKTMLKLNYEEEGGI